MKNNNQGIAKSQVVALLLGVLFLCFIFLADGCGKYEEYPSKEKKETPTTETVIDEHAGKDLVDYTQRKGSVTTVSKATPGQQFINEKSDWDQYRGFQFAIDLPKGIGEDDLTFQDDYVARTLTITVPEKYDEAFSNVQLKGILNGVAEYEYNPLKHAIVVQFANAFAFHYVVEQELQKSGGAKDKQNILYVKYGPASYYYDHVVVIDPGHGGEDFGGYTWDQVYVEKEVAQAVSEYLYQDYAAQDEIMVYFTRVDDSNVSLYKRIALANDMGADLFLSLHCNYMSYGVAYGTETCYNQNDKNKPFNSKWFAKKIQNAYVKSSGLYDRGLLPDGELKVLRLAKMPACLLELGFITNPGDAAVMAKKSNQKKTANTIETVIKEALEEMENE